MYVCNFFQKTYKTINQSPVVAPVEAWVKCSNDASFRILTALSLQQKWQSTNNAHTRRKDALSAILLHANKLEEKGWEGVFPY